MAKTNLTYWYHLIAIITVCIDKSTDPPRAFAGRHPLLPFRAGLYMYLVYLAEGVVCPE